MNRRLAAILAADVAGYSRLIEQDEAGTLAALRERRKTVLDPTVAQYHGRVVKVMGDGVLIEFGSAVNAVACAVELQKRFAVANERVADNQRIILRVGVNLGDVVVEGGDLYGDGVIIAVRLQAMAEPGGICVSGSVHEQVAGKLDAAFADLGQCEVKNSSKPVRVFRLRSSDPEPARPVLALPDKPSIAVLPFSNMSGDPEQEYFADGIVEDIITALSRFHDLFVIARNSSFTYKGRAVDLKQVGRELGVQYLLEGSVRKAGSRVRITGQLIDATTGAHLWADRFEGGMEDIFDLQDQVAGKVVGAIAPKLEAAEIERVKRKPTESLGAYDHYLRGVAGIHMWSREGNDQALFHFRKAIELDRTFAAAYGMAARTFVQRKAGGWTKDNPQELVEMEQLADKAADLSHDDAVALSAAGFALSDLLHRVEDGDELIDRALLLNPNLASAWLYSGWVKVALGKYDVALDRIITAERLSPNDPQRFSMLAARAFAHLFARRFTEAYTAGFAAMRNRPRFLLATCIVAASAALAGNRGEAAAAIERIREIDPSLRLGGVGSLTPVPNPENLALWLDGLKKAGLGE